MSEQQQALVPTLGGAEARRLTNEVRRDLVSAREKLLRLYEGEAHLALGYSSWRSYWETEFETSWRSGYRELGAARVDRAIDQLDNQPLPEGQARELIPLLDEPDDLRSVMRDLREEHGERLTAATIREAVEKKLRPRTSATEASDGAKATTGGVRGDELVRAQQTLDRAYTAAAGLIAAWIDAHPDEDVQTVCKQVAPISWQALEARVRRRS